MSATTAADKQWFGHPRGLSTLFFTELWERFSYYGMRGILVLFMVDQLHGLQMDRPTAAAIYGLYTAGVYILALPGGWIADRLIGQKRAVFYGGIVIALGHFTLAVPSTFFFYLGLILIVIGTGLLKPNVSAIVGDLYPEGGGRRDAGFSIFYMGINIGAFAGPLVCGYLGETWNWHWGFAAAGVGMVVGLIQYKLGQPYLGTAGERSASVTGDDAGAWKSFYLGLATIAGLVVVLFLLDSAGIVPITLQGFAQATTYIIVGLAISYFAYQLMFGGLGTDEKKRLVVIFLMFVGAALFWSGFEQAGSSMNLFAEAKTDRLLGDWEMPASWLQSVNPLFIIILAPVFGWLWIALGTRNPSIPTKFGLGLVLLGLGFVVMRMAAAKYEAVDAGLSPMWLITTYFLHTCGELCLSPVGLSSVTKLSPRRLVGQMMGIWFMGAALGNLIAGLAAGQEDDVALFTQVATVGVVSGIAFLVLSKLIQNLIVFNGEKKAI